MVDRGLLDRVTKTGTILLLEGAGMSPSDSRRMTEVPGRTYLLSSVWVKEYHQLHLGCTSDISDHICSDTGDKRT